MGSLLEFSRNAAFLLLLASLLPFLFPLLALCSYFLLLLLFPLLCAFLFLALFHRFSSAFLSALARFVPLWISRFVCSAWPSRQYAAASLHRHGAENSPCAPLDPVEFQEVSRDGRAKTLPSRPASAFEASDICFIPRDEQWVSLEEKPLLDHRKSTEEISFPGPTTAREVEIRTDIPSAISSFLSEAYKQKQIVQETPPNDEEELLFHDSTGDVSPCEPEPPSVREIFDKIPTTESRQISNLGSEGLQYPEEDRVGISKSVSSVLLESVPQKEEEDVLDALPLQGTGQQLIISLCEDCPRLRTRELSAEDVSGECETTSVHPDRKDEITNDRELEGMPGTEVSHSDNEQASELRYDLSEENAGVPQPMDVKPMDLSILEHTEGFKPTAGEGNAFSEASLGFSTDRLSASEIARSAGTYSGADDDLLTRIPQEDAPEMCEEQAFKRDTTGEELSRGPEVVAAESDIENSEDETSRATCASSPTLGGVSESGFEPLKETIKEDHSEPETTNRVTSVLESINESTGDPAIQVRTSKEINMLADIDAIKKIIGYEGDLHGGLVEQIRALHVFVGMEPSFSVVNGDDLENAWEELEVLKVVIGLE